MIYLLIALIVFIIDYSTKQYVLKNLKNREKKYILKNTIKLSLHKNEGLFLGLLKEKTNIVKTINYVATTVVIIFYLVAVFSKWMTGLSKAGLSLIVGGALGNVYDRMKNGKVTDFFAFSYKPTIIYNLADIFIFIGGVILIIGELFDTN